MEQDKPGIAPLNNSDPNVGNCREPHFNAPRAQHPELAELRRTSPHKAETAREIGGKIKTPRPPGKPNCRRTTRGTDVPQHLCEANHIPGSRRTSALGLLGDLLGLAAAARALLRRAPLRAALGRALGGLPLAALLRGRLPARGTSLRRHGSERLGTTGAGNFFELRWRESQRHRKNTANTTPDHPGRHNLTDYTAQTTLDNTHADTT